MVEKSSLKENGPGVGVMVGVSVGVGVSDGTRVAVAVGTGVGVSVGSGVAVSVGMGVLVLTGTGDAASMVAVTCPWLPQALCISKHTIDMAINIFKF